MKKKTFLDIIDETIKYHENLNEEYVNNILNEGIIDGFKKLANASKDKLSVFKEKFTEKTKEILKSTLSKIVKAIIDSISSKKNVDVQSQLSENPLFKDFIEETDAINEIKSEFNNNAAKELIAKKDVVTDSIIFSNINNNIITEDFSDSVDTITTKIFSSVYKIIAGTLEKLGYAIKPEFRNWYDKLVRKIQKKFYNTKLGQSISDLPPEVKDDVMEKFQAIIGVVVIIIMTWIIISTFNGENIDANTENADNSSVSNSNIDDISNNTESAASKQMFLPDKDTIDTKINYSNEPKEIYDMRVKYINERYNAIKDEYPNMSAMQQNAWRHKAAVEFDASFAHDKILKIEDGKIIRTDINADETGIYTDITANADNLSKYEANYDKYDYFYSTRFINSNYDVIRQLRINYINERLEILQQAHDIPADKIETIKDGLKSEFMDAIKHGKILSIQNNKIIETDATDFLNLSDNIDALKNIGIINDNVADFENISSKLLDDIPVESFIKNGITNIKFIDRGITVNLDIERIPKNMLNLDAKEIADKVVKEYAQAHNNLLNGI